MKDVQSLSMEVKFCLKYNIKVLFYLYCKFIYSRQDLKDGDF